MEAKKMRELVVDRIAKSIPQITEDVVDALSGEEIKRRTNLVVRAFKKLGEIEKDISQTNEDQKNYNSEGKVVNASFSKQAYDELNAKKQKAQKITKAIEKGLNEKDFSALAKFGK